MATTVSQPLEKRVEQLEAMFARLLATRGWLARIRAARDVHEEVPFYSRLVGLFRFVAAWPSLSSIKLVDSTEDTQTFRVELTPHGGTMFLGLKLSQ
jgi:hypothetical protein